MKRESPTSDDSSGTTGETFHLSERFLQSLIQWENAPHNVSGSDKTWVERLNDEWLDHYRAAVRVR